MFGENLLLSLRVPHGPVGILCYFSFIIENMFRFIVRLLFKWNFHLLLELRIQLCEPIQDGKFVLHAEQLQMQKYCKANEFYKMINLADQADSLHSFLVQDTSVLEVVIAKWWASPGEVKLNYRISFHGLKPDQNQVTMVTLLLTVLSVIGIGI